MFVYVCFCILSVLLTYLHWAVIISLLIIITLDTEATESMSFIV